MMLGGCDFGGAIVWFRRHHHHSKPSSFFLSLPDFQTVASTPFFSLCIASTRSESGASLGLLCPVAEGVLVSGRLHLGIAQRQRRRKPRRLRSLPNPSPQQTQTRAQGLVYTFLMSVPGHWKRCPPHLWYLSPIHPHCRSQHKKQKKIVTLRLHTVSRLVTAAS